MSNDTLTNRKRLLAYIGDVRRALRMDNWDVVLHEDLVPDEEEAHADTWQHENHAVLNLRISTTFFDLDPSGIRNTVIHELTHAQHRDVTRLWEKASRGALSETQLAAWDEEFRTHMERFVSWTTDRIEGSIATWDPTASVPKELPMGCYLNEKPH